MQNHYTYGHNTKRHQIGKQLLGHSPRAVKYSAYTRDFDFQREITKITHLVLSPTYLPIIDMRECYSSFLSKEITTSGFLVLHLAVVGSSGGSAVSGAIIIGVLLGSAAFSAALIAEVAVSYFCII